MIKTDYLVVGAGAAGMIFADEMLTHSDARIVIVDRRFCPGGHWNDAYPFVRLHQPSAFYGAGSRELGSRRIETSGPNAGLYQQAGGAEISAYFEQLMHERLLPSGRVQFFPLHDYQGDWSGNHRIISLVNGESRQVHVASKLVDTTFYRVSTPLTHKPSFEVGRGVQVIPPNGLPNAVAPHRKYVVIGGGKTSMDVLIWLLEHGVRADALKWIVPRDSWLINRETIQPGDAGMARMVEGQAHYLDAAAHASCLDEFYDRLERAGELLRVDPNVRPGMFHQATISHGELGMLRQVRNLIRASHVRRIEANVMVFDMGEMPTEPDALYIDCTARSISWRTTKPVFDGPRITMQFVRDGRMSFSAAAIGFVEAIIGDERRKNNLCARIPYEEHLVTLPKAMLAELRNGEAWSKDPEMRDWARKHRLAGFTSGSAPSAVLDNLREKIAYLRPRAVANLDKLITTYEYDEDPSEYTRPEFPIGIGVERSPPPTSHRWTGSGSETSLLQ
ncbi:NAD(P)/FAD-dependent oxidoreductase [Pseudomonadota bacterium]